MPREVFRKLSQNPEYTKTVCIDRNNSFHLACRRWMVNQ